LEIAKPYISRTCLLEHLGSSGNVRPLVAAVIFSISVSAVAQTPEERLFEAIEVGKPLVAEGIVAGGKVDVDARNAEQETPLHKAIEKGMKELAEMLVKAGAKVDARDANSDTPLHQAALHDDPYFVELLLRAKADAKARNDDGESVLQWAVMTGNPQVARDLLEHGADPMATDLKGNTVLHAAADSGSLGMVEAFLSLGVDPRQRNRAGQRPIDVARERDHAEIVKLLERFEKD